MGGDVKPSGPPGSLSHEWARTSSESLVMVRLCEVGVEVTASGQDAIPIYMDSHDADSLCDVLAEARRRREWRAGK